MSARIYPELVSGRLDGFQQGAWKVEKGSVLRGGAHCNLTERSLRVPDGDDEVARVVRAHELVHIRVSPFLSEHTPLDAEVPGRALECAEEYRVNLILSRLGFDTVQLCDGTERLGGERLARSGQWAEAVCFLLAVLGTGAEAKYLRGVRAGDPTWVAALRLIKKKATNVVVGLDAECVGDTSLNEEGVPRGFDAVTLPIARMLARAMSAAPPTDPDALRNFRRSLEPGARRPPSGVFAPLVLDQSVDYVARVGRSSHRRARPSTSGTVMRYPGRILTDPLQRAFARQAPAAGGVIVIDQSGSMDVTVEEIEKLVRRAPNAIIIGYSHRPGDRGETSNAWILAQAGRVAYQARAGNIGNGVDGPVLRWALGRRRYCDPVIWVTDGQVTDSNDHPCHRLSLECARLVQRHRIRLVRTLGEAETALRGRSYSATKFGRVGRVLEELSTR